MDLMKHLWVSLEKWPNSWKREVALPRPASVGRVPFYSLDFLLN